MPAAPRHSAPSSRARRCNGRTSGSGPQSASIALPRLLRSLPYFHRMMSGRATDSKVDAANAAAIASALSSTPCGKRPTSRMPVIGAACASTTPGSRCSAGHTTHTPYTSSKQAQRRRLVGDAVLHRHHRDRSRVRWRRARCSALPVCWLFIARSTTSSSRKSMPAGCETTGIESVTVSSSGVVEPQAVVADRVVVVAARDQHHLVPVLAPTGHPPPRRSHRRRTPRIACGAASHTGQARVGGDAGSGALPFARRRRRFPQPVRTRQSSAGREREAGDGAAALTRARARPCRRGAPRSATRSTTRDPEPGSVRALVAR